MSHLKVTTQKNPMDLNAMVKAFAHQAVEGYHRFKQFRFLYYSSPEQIDLLNASAKGFFADLFRMYLDLIILDIARMADPQWQRGNRNLTAHTVHENCKVHSGYATTKAEPLIKRLKEIADELIPLRMKEIAHTDYDVALGTKVLQAQVIPANVEAFYQELSKFVSLVYESVFSGFFDIDSVSYYGADELVRTLQEGMDLRKILDHEPYLYDRIRSSLI